MSILETIQNSCPQIKNRKLIGDTFGLIEKARSGVYSDNPENRRLRRVGQKYGSGKQQEKPTVKPKKQEEGKKYDRKKTEEYAKKASDEVLKLAVEKHDDPMVKEVAKKELESRGNSEEGRLQGKIDSLKNEISSRREAMVKLDDWDKIAAESKEIQKLVNQHSQLIEDQKALRKVPFKEYMKGFNDYSNSQPSEVVTFYTKGYTEVEDYLDNNPKIGESVKIYAGEGYKDIREHLSSGKKDKELDSIVDDLSQLINDNKIQENMILNRRVKGDGVKFFKSLKKGDIYEDQSFSSTSLRELGQFGEFNIAILAKKDSNVCNLNNFGEVEYLIDKGSRFRLLDKNENGIIVELL